MKRPFGAALILSLVAFSCGDSSKVQSRAGALETVASGTDDVVIDRREQPAAEEPGDASDSGGMSLAELPVAIGIRNYEQINETFSVLTGVPSSNATVRAFFLNEVAASLPTENDIKAFQGAHQVAIAKLAVEYCDVLARDATLRAQVIPGFNFAGTPAQVFDAAGKALVASALIDRFWGVGRAGLPPRDQSIAAMSALIDQILQGKVLTNVALTPNVVVGVCAAVLSAAPVTIL